MMRSRLFLSSTSSPEEIMLAEEAPRTASIAALSPDFAASYSALPASCGLLKVFCPGSWAQATPAHRSSDAINTAGPTNFDCHRIYAPFRFLSNIHQPPNQVALVARAVS